MDIILQCTFAVILIVELVIGSLGNVFMALINIMEWVKRRKISSVDQLLTALAISRLALICTFVVSLLISVLYPDLMMNGKVMRTIGISWVVSNHFSVWISTCLGFFYFLKIANFTHSIFLYLKWRVRRVVTGSLLVSLPILFINTCINIHIFHVMDGYKTNVSYTLSSNTIVQLYRLILLTNSVFMFIPYTLALTTFLLLTVSLWRHHKKMQHNAQGCRDTSTTVHITALQTLITFLLLYTIFFLSFLLQSWGFDFLHKNVIVSFLLDVGMAFPSVHSWVLILKSSKLRRAFLCCCGG